VVRRAARITLPRLREIAGLEEPVPATRDVAPPPPTHAANVHDPLVGTEAGAEATSSGTEAGAEAPTVPHLPPVVTPPEAPVVAPPPGAPVPPIPPPSHLSAVPDPPPLPPQPETPRSARPAATTPGPGSDEEDARGILLQGAFDDGPGEYRLVRGRFVDSEHGEPVVPERASATWDESRDRRAGAGPEVRDVQWLRRRTDPARREARAASAPAAAPKRAPQRAPRELPIRALGFAGFAIGIAGSLYWMSLSSQSGIPTLPELPALVDAESPGVEAPVATEAPEPTVAPEPPPAPAAPEPAPAPEASVASVPKPFPPPEVVPAPKPATPAPASAPPVAVSINATPWAVIEVDGRELGETPLAGVSLAPGVHLFRARMPDGTTRERAIEIAPDNDTVVFQ
jgi:hypothetical protein